MKSRSAVPSYTMRGYRVRGIAYGFGQIPVERAAADLGIIAPGKSSRAGLRFTQPAIARVQVDILRPDGFSVWTETWQY